MNPTPLADDHTAYLSLLRTWGDGLIAHQVPAGLRGLSGGILCPACARVHGRCGDAVYPLLLLYGRTGDEAYRDAARALFDWSSSVASRPDGAWINEVAAAGAEPWKGITCFSVLALGEALHRHGHLLPAEDRVRWARRLGQGADFLLGFADTLEANPSIDVNYLVSTAAALACAGAALGEGRYRDRARSLADQALHFFTPGGLLWGEGTRDPAALSPGRSLHPIDLGYNVEESLPNLALYGALCGDEDALSAAAASFAAHLDFLLPDGAWDAGWGSRQFKWAYWGSRTSDGCASGLLLLKDRDPRFAEAAARNLGLLALCTHDGLLYGGPHVRSRGALPCIHHTFCHAKALAAALDAGVPAMADAPPVRLPRDIPRGVREVPEAALYLVDVGPWRATVSANDTAYHGHRLSQPGGGSLAVLWHEAAGPVAAASMNEYRLLEGGNMQTAWAEADRYCLTPRLELRGADGGAVFSNVYDPATDVRVVGGGTAIGAQAVEVWAQGRLLDHRGQDPPGGPLAFTLAYRFDDQSVTVEASIPDGAPAGIVLHFPLIAESSEPAAWVGGRLGVRRAGGATIRLSPSAEPDSRETGRLFNFVPGFEAVPVRLPVPAGATVRIHIAVE